MSGLARVLALNDDDGPILGRLGPLFVAAGAASILVASGSKALFLGENPIDVLPWVFLGQAALGIASALAFVAVTARFDRVRRWTALGGVAAASLGGLRLLQPLFPRAAALVAVVWAPSVAQLVLVQTWGFVGSLLPSRQSKRLIPVLSALATVGAILGGLVAGVVSRSAGAEELLTVAAGVFAASAVAGPRLVAPLAARERSPASALPPTGSADVGQGLADIVANPLLRYLAGIVFFTQVASVLLDYQWSGELRAAYGKDELAAFLATFYAVGNALVLGVSLLFTQRLVQTLGVGFSAASVAGVTLAGSAAYLAACFGAFPRPLVVLVATATLERLAQFALGRNATQMLLAPLEGGMAERARTLVDGVVHRSATLFTSVGLLLAAPQHFVRLSPWAMAAAGFVLVLGGSVRGRYRRALYDSLRAGRVDAIGPSRFLVDAYVVEEIRAALQSPRGEEALAALDLAATLGVPLPREALVALARHRDPRLPARVLELLAARGEALPPEELEALLRPERDVVVLRAALGALPQEPPASLARAVERLLRHPDASVAALARIAARAHAGAVFSRTASLATGGRPALRTILAQGGTRSQLGAIDAIGRAGVAGGLDALFEALEESDLRPAATLALARFGERLAPFARDALETGRGGLPARFALVAALERTRSAAARDVLMARYAVESGLLHDRIALGLWRLGQDPERAPPPAWTVERARERIAALRALRAAEREPRHEGAAFALLRAELRHAARRAETRVFELLGLLYGRRPMHRAAIHAHSAVPRVRSNALELLDEHVRNPDLRPFIELLEHGRIRTDASSLPPAGDLGPFLERVRRHCEGAVDDPELAAALELSRVPLFADLACEVLLPLAAAARRRSLAPGEVLLAVGDPPDALHVVVRGTLRVAVPGAPRIGAGECVGELALLDPAPRSATVVAEDEAEVLSVREADFRTHLETQPSFARALLRLLGQRVRAHVAREVA